MADQPTASTDVRLTAADAHELADLLGFLRDWLSGSETEALSASLEHFPDSAGTDTLPELQLALTRFASLLTPTAGEVDF